MTTDIDHAAEVNALKIAGWPWPLIKAVYDPFAYRLRLSDGTIVSFESAQDPFNVEGSTEYATLLNPTIWWEPMARFTDHKGYAYEQRGNLHLLDVDRGFCVRVSEIVWIVDAPEGS